MGTNKKNMKFSNEEIIKQIEEARKFQKSGKFKEAEKIYSDAYKSNDNSWPKIDNKMLEDEKVNIVVQINGKKREMINVERNINENKLLKILESNERIKKFMTDKEIKKKIFVPNRIINFIIK